MISDKVQKQPSQIHGYGLFAKVPIKKGEIISQETNIIKMSIQVYENLPASEKRVWETYAYPYLGNMVLTMDDGRYINHSDKPNVVSAQVASRDIEAGEELNEDYSDYTSPEFLKIKSEKK